MNQVRRSQGKKRAQRGVSLLEVLIVLAILVIGILSVIRLFPSGFFSIESAGTAANADSLAQEMLSAQTQAGSGLPEAILPGGLPMSMTAAQYTDGDYDPDDPNLLDNARYVQNETITVPAPQAAGGQSRSLYTVNYGPIVLPVSPGAVTRPNYLTINSPYWKAMTGDSTTANGVNPDPPQDTLLPGQQSFLVDLANGRIALPYAQYDQIITLWIVDSNGAHVVDLKLPHAGNASPAATDAHNGSTYYPDSATYYNGGWFDPGNTMLAYDTDTPVSVPAAPWKAAMLYRPFQGMANTGLFTADPYQFTIPNANMGAGTNLNGTGADLNLGVIQFNPLAAGGSGSSALKAQISYQSYDWQIIHEDRDVPALNTGDQYIARLTLKGLKTVGQAYPDTNPDGTANANTNTPYAGIAGSGQDVVVLDLDTGQPISASVLNDEDKNGTLGGRIDVGHSVGRLVFQSGAIGDTAAHRVRIFYQAVGDWTVAMQKAPDAYAPIAAAVYGTSMDPQIGPGQFGFDTVLDRVYFPRCDVGRTVEMDGLYVSSGTTQTFTDTVSIDGIAPLGAGTTKYGYVDLTNGNRLGQPIPAGATVTFTAVRGLSTRAVVAWKERNHWKVHDVDTVLSRAQSPPGN